MATPLSALLKGMEKGVKTGPFSWIDDAETAFCRLCKAFPTAPVLQHFDPFLHIRVETDASGYAVAGILNQLHADSQWHPIAYCLRKIIDAETRYQMHDQELLAIVAAFKHWRHYLEGSRRQVQVMCDHVNLQRFMELLLLNGWQACWALLLAAFDFVVVYQPGKSNLADRPLRQLDYAGVAKPLPSPLWQLRPLAMPHN